MRGLYVASCTHCFLPFLRAVAGRISIRLLLYPSSSSPLLSSPLSPSSPLRFLFPSLAVGPNSP